MPKNFVYSENFTDDRRSPTKSGMTKKAFVSEHPLEGCTRTSPEPALSKAEWAGMTAGGAGMTLDGRE